jgi:hypothetical protein
MRVVLTWASFCGAGIAHAQGDPPATTLSASASSPVPKDGPKRGTWEISIPIGIAQNYYGSTISASASTEMQGGIGFGYHFSPTTSVSLGFAGRGEELFHGAEAHLDIRYRVWDLHPILKPFIVGGIGHSWDFPRVGKDRRTITAVELRTGGGFDLALSPRFMWGLQVVVDPGPRILPNVTAFFNVSFTAAWTFLL